MFLAIIYGITIVISTKLSHICNNVKKHDNRNMKKKPAIRALDRNQIRITNCFYLSFSIINVTTAHLRTYLSLKYITPFEMAYIYIYECSSASHSHGI